jgi:hypothetical protein
MTPPLPWKLIGRIAVPVLVLLVAWWLIRSYADRVADGREAEVRAEYAAAEERATTKHNERIAEVETTYDAKLTTLQAERDAALARPATRTLRVPVSAVCPAASPSDAGVPQPDPGAGYVEVHDGGYDSFRAWLIQYAAGSEDGR